MQFREPKKAIPLLLTGALLCLNPYLSSAGEDEDAPGFLRSYTWEGSFDRAGDATRAAEVELKKRTENECKEADFQTTDATADEVASKVAQCKRIQREAKHFGQEAEGIRKTQRIFSNVSHVSDMAAIGSIGAIGYAEMFKKQPGQAGTYDSAANIQETAGYASYASGATDFAMGAWAFGMQKRRLEAMKEVLSKKANDSNISTSDAAAISKLTAAAEQTKSAAYSHMMYGAGKAAVGYASMYLAKKNREQAALMGSIDPNAFMPPQAPAVAPTISSSNQNGELPYYQNNQVSFITPGQSTDANGMPVSNNGTIPTYGAGASAMPSPEFRNLASSGGKTSGLGGGGGGGGGGITQPPTVGAADALTADATATKEAMGQTFEISLAGGGGSRYGGGAGDAKKEDETPSVSQILGGMLGADNKPSSKATGVNANSIYREATQGLNGDEEQGSMSGVNGGGRTLFEVVKSKYNKMMEVGRLQGPGAVEVKN